MKMIGFTQSSYPVFYAPPMRITKLFWFSNSRAKEKLIFQVSQYFMISFTEKL